MGVKRFKAASAAKRGIKAEFEIEWEDEKTGETGVETFYCFPGRAVGSTYFDITTAGQGSGPMWALFEQTMGENFEAFKVFIEDGRHGVDSDAIREIVAFIMEYDTGVPPEPSIS